MAVMTPSKKSWVIVSTGLVLLSFLFFISLPLFNGDTPPPTPQIAKVSFHAPRQNVWADLSEHETEDTIARLAATTPPETDKALHLLVSHILPISTTL
jgi:hypothetical protein